LTHLHLDLELRGLRAYRLDAHPIQARCCVRTHNDLALDDHWLRLAVAIPHLHRNATATATAAQ
jgi:hypothetical protein